ncbi:tryptophan transporter [Cytobacillus gottheilii]|uniref:tryptophan transporter n=1 Tax=Cytobacillus gottheilii TaxID=859144 RepID=UPI0024956AA5|nr:tryptophan transporter [Cytobacillus gottheilii]
MNSKNLVALALLVGMGAVLHTVVPGFVFGMKPDMMLTMMFLGILLFPDVRSVLLLGIATGVISALTTSFPLGQIPNMIDKPITAFLFFGIYLIIKKFNKPTLSVAILTAAGTLISGVIFLTAAYLLVGLPGAFAILFTGTVLPAMAINTVLMIILYPVAQTIGKRTKLIPASN